MTLFDQDMVARSMVTASEEIKDKWCRAAKEYVRPEIKQTIANLEKALEENQ